MLLDGAQAVPHLRVDVRELDCDFYAFSGHKMFAPTGIGVLYGRERLLEAMPPWQGGGDMILKVSFEGTTFNAAAAQVRGRHAEHRGRGRHGRGHRLSENIGMERIGAYEHGLLEYGTEALKSVRGLRLIGTAAEKASVLSFVLDGIHAHDIGTILDSEGIAIRTGHHCAMPVMDFFGVPATARASLAFYNTREEIDRLVAALAKAREVFG